MPQLIPFYFINQVAMTIILLSILFIILGTIILPNVVRSFISRTEINKI